MSEAIGHDLGRDAGTPQKEPAVRNREVALRLLASNGRHQTVLAPVPDAEVEEEETTETAEGAPPESPPEAPPSQHLRSLLLARGLDVPELRLQELTEIERMRDLEIARLEEELAEKSRTIFDLETELFHAARRGDDLDRRWNELAKTYEVAAARLVEAGGRLEAIESQAGYRAMLGFTSVLRRQPRMYTTLRRFARRALFGLAD